MEGRFLRISGVKEDELKKNTDLRWRFVERDQGTFNRRIRLPLTVLMLFDVV